MQGFVTIATGNERYFRMAANLLKSYRLSTKEPKPFCIIADKKNHYTELFDDVIVIENVTRSYLDKFLLIPYAPYDETIFIDADCLAYCDLNSLFPVFSDASDFSCFGGVYPLGSEEGWFTDERLGKYKNKISYIVGLHGGIYFIRKSEKLNDLYQTALDIAGEFEKYSFRWFRSPADEPIYAMAMAVCNFKPIPEDLKYFAWLIGVKIDKVDFFSRNLAYHTLDGSGNVAEAGWMLHFGHAMTVRPLYCIESAKINYEYVYHKKWNLPQSIVYQTTGCLFGVIDFCAIAFRKICREVKRRFMHKSE